MINILRRVGRPMCVIAALLIASCASPVPQAELDAYRSAFAAARTANDTFLEQYVAAERSLRNGVGPGEFVAEDAAYYATIGKPPLSRQIARAYNAIAAYNEVLITLAEGRSWEVIRPHVDRAASGFAAVASLFGPEGAAAGVGIKLGGELFNELGSALRGVTDRQQAQQLVLEHTDDVVAVIDALIGISPGLYEEMTHSLIEAQANAAAADQMVDAAAVAGRIKATRVLVANWVVLLQDTKGALQDLKFAAAQGSLSGPDSADIAFWSEEVAEHAVAIKAAAMTLAQHF